MKVESAVMLIFIIIMITAVAVKNLRVFIKNTATKCIAKQCFKNKISYQQEICFIIIVRMIQQFIRIIKGMYYFFFEQTKRHAQWGI